MQLMFIVQGKTEIGQVIRSFLVQANYPVRLFRGPAGVMAEAEKHRPVLIFIEAGCAEGSGADQYSLIRTIPALADTPVIMFSSSTGDQDRIHALEAGADDYIGHPFSRRELIARVHAILRRFSESSQRLNSFSVHSRTQSSGWEGLPLELITMGDIQIDTSAMKVSVRGTEVLTTALEFRLMYYLAKHQYRVFTRDQLLDAVWGDNQFVTPRSVDACIRRIRRKIEPDRSRPTYLKTVRGAGYLLDVATAARHYAPQSTKPSFPRERSVTSLPSLPGPVLKSSLEEA